MSIYAIVIENKVDNVIVADPHNASKIAKAKDGIAVYAEHYPIQPNDDYINNQFMRDGKIIERIPTPEELIAELNQEILLRDQALLDSDFRITLLELGV